jgi:hypothetical protein
MAQGCVPKRYAIGWVAAKANTPLNATIMEVLLIGRISRRFG